MKEEILKFLLNLLFSNLREASKVIFQEAVEIKATPCLNIRGAASKNVRRPQRNIPGGSGGNDVSHLQPLLHKSMHCLQDPREKGPLLHPHRIITGSNLAVAIITNFPILSHLHGLNNQVPIRQVEGTSVLPPQTLTGGQIPVHAVSSALVGVG